MKKIKEIEVGKAFCQGDVTVIRLKEIPKKALENKKKHLRLAEGEVTGHSHQISKGEGSLFEFNDKLYMRIQSEIGVLSHEEHGGYEFPSGDYEVKIQRRHTPQGAKKVID